MPSKIKVLAYDADDVADEQVELKEEGECSEPIEVRRTNGEQPHASREGQECKNTNDVEWYSIGVQVTPFLFIVRWRRKDESGLFEGPICRTPFEIESSEAAGPFGLSIRRGFRTTGSVCRVRCRKADNTFLDKCLFVKWS